MDLGLTTPIPDTPYPHIVYILYICIAISIPSTTNLRLVQKILFSTHTPHVLIQVFVAFHTSVTITGIAVNFGSHLQNRICMDFFTSRCVRFLLACCSHSVLVKCSILHRRLCVHLCDVQKGVTTYVVYAVIYASRALYDQHGVTIAFIQHLFFCWCICCMHSSFHF